MSAWKDLLRIIVEEVGRDDADRIEARACAELGGLRLTIGKRSSITAADVHKVAPGRPREAARILGIHPSTAYRAIRRGPRRGPFVR